MPEYVLLLYAPEVDEAGQAQRWSEMPLWNWSRRACGRPDCWS